MRTHAWEVAILAAMQSGALTLRPAQLQHLHPLAKLPMVASKASGVVTTATTIAIVGTATLRLGVCQRTHVWEIAIPATTQSGALVPGPLLRPRRLQLPLQARPRRPRRLLQGTSLATMAWMRQWKLVVTTAMMIAIAAAATQRLAA
jgi:hypothetical protein